jgi:RNA polymerase sigma-70 factor (ECF subfamily)
VADDDAVVALYDEFAAPLFAYALRRCGSRERAEEVVQDALVRAWRHPESLGESHEARRAWLYTVVRNALTDAWRRDGARPTIVSSRVDDVARDGGLERAVESWTLRDAASRLSDDHRRVLHHAFFLGQSVDQTAAALRVAPGTVKSRTYYALRALRVVLEEMGYVQ